MSVRAQARPNVVVENPSCNLAPVICIFQYPLIGILRREKRNVPLQTHRHRHEDAAH